MTLAEGSVVGRYTVGRLLGSGGMGDVYVARDEGLGRRVALKVLSPKYALDAREEERFREEARTLSALNHPNILTIFDVGDAGGRPFLATELVEGKTLRQLLSTTHLRLPDALSIAAQVASALAAAQAAGIVHRDLKPENVMLRPDGWVKVLDFGLAKAVERRATPEGGSRADTATEHVVGTIPYMSPEQLRGQEVDLRTDVWSAGAVLYEMLAGRAPFAGASPSDLIVAILTETPPPLAPHGVPPAVERIVTKALAKSRDRRHPTMEALLFDLKGAQRLLDSGAVSGVEAAVSIPSSDAVPAARADSGPAPPAARDAPSHPNNLPADVTPFVGREAEVDGVVAALSSEGTRLVTLTGPGGAGKTRLALEAARRLLARSRAEPRSDPRGAAPPPEGAGALFLDGVFLAPLASVVDPAAVPAALAAAMSVAESPAAPAEAAVVAALARRRALLVLDGFEHVVDAAPLLSRLLAAAPAVKLLVTSREVLRLSGEREIPVAPLAVPDLDRLPPLDALARYSAVALFVERARAARRDFQLTSENAEAVAGICARLDGLPLAIELAAARVKLLPPGAILPRLDKRLALLTGGPRDLPDRQRTMRGALEWGHQLLSDEDKRLFARLAVFAASFRLEAAEAVAGDAGGRDVLEGLASLADKSLLRREERGDAEARFSMLQTLREFAAEHLAESGEEASVRARHAAWFLALAERAGPELAGAGQGPWLDRLEEESDDLRAAFRHLAGRRDAAAVLRLAGSLWWYWYVRGHYAEGRALLEEALGLAAGAAEAPAAARLSALLGAGVVAFLQCDYAHAERRLDEATGLARTLGDASSLAKALQFRGSVARERGDLPRAAALHEESRLLSSAAGDAHAAARSTNSLALAAWLSGDSARARALAEMALEAFRSSGDREGLAWALLNLASAARYAADVAAAISLAREALSTSREVGFREGMAWALDVLGNAARTEGATLRAEEFLSRSLELHWDLGDRWRTASVLESLGETAAADDPSGAGPASPANARPERALRLLAAADALRAAIGAPVPPVERKDRDLALAALRERLGVEAFERGFAAARGTPLPEAVALALGRR